MPTHLSATNFVREILPSSTVHPCVTCTMDKHTFVMPICSYGSVSSEYLHFIRTPPSTMVFAIQNPRLIVGCSVLMVSIPALHLFLLLFAIASATGFLEMCNFVPPNVPAKFRVLVARCSAWSATLLIIINMLLRVCRFVHVFVVHGICLGLKRLELRCVFGILSLGLVVLNFETIQAVCSTTWNAALSYPIGRDVKE